MADQTYLIAASATGADPNNWSVVSTLLSTVSTDITLRTLEWEFEPYSKYTRLANGQKRGMGFPIARWIFKGLRPGQRENLRDFCLTVSADVYIRTPTSETSGGVRTYGDYSAILSWMERSEIASDGIGVVEQTELTFTHLVEVGT